MGIPNRAHFVYTNTKMSLQVAACNNMGGIAPDGSTTGMNPEKHMHIANDFYSPGVADITSHFVAAPGGGKSVNIANGAIYVQNAARSGSSNTETKLWRVQQAEAAGYSNKTIADNNLGGTRIDIIAVVVNAASSGGDNGELPPSILVQPGTVINTAPYGALPENCEVICEVHVPNGFSSITAGMLIDKRRPSVPVALPDWNPIPTITRVSDTSFKLSGDWRGVIGRGTKLKFYQEGAWKYFSVISSGSLASNETTYSAKQATNPSSAVVITSSTITLCQISNGSPVDFPEYATYAHIHPGFPIVPRFYTEQTAATTGLSSGTWSNLTGCAQTINLTDFPGTVWHAYITASAQGGNSGNTPSGMAIRVTGGVATSAEGWGAVAYDSVTATTRGGAALSARVTLNGGSSYTLQLQARLLQSNAGFADKGGMIITLQRVS